MPDGTRALVLDVLGNQSISLWQKSAVLVREIFKAGHGPERREELLRLALEGCGLAPRHETPPDPGLLEAVPPEAAAEELRRKLGPAQDHEIKGWFVVHAERPVEQTLAAIRLALEGEAGEAERAVFLERILKSPHVPLPAVYFSRDTDDPEGDGLLLRRHAETFVRLRQALNMRGPTVRGSLLLDFLAPLRGDPRAQAVLLGALLEELLRRLQKLSREGGAARVGIMPLEAGGDPEEMVRRMRRLLPPEVMEQLRRLFSQPEDGA